MDNKLFSWIEQELKDRDWSYRKLAREMGISGTHVVNVLSGNRNVTFEFCAGLARAFDEPAERVFRLAGLLPPLLAVDDPIIEEIMDIARAMTPQNQQDLLKYARFRYQQQEEK